MKPKKKKPDPKRRTKGRTPAAKTRTGDPVTKALIEMVTTLTVAVGELMCRLPARDKQVAGAKAPVKREPVDTTMTLGERAFFDRLSLKDQKAFRKVGQKLSPMERANLLRRLDGAPKGRPAEPPIPFPRGDAFLQESQRKAESAERASRAVANQYLAGNDEGDLVDLAQLVDDELRRED